MRYPGPANGLGGRCIDLQGQPLGLVHKPIQRAEHKEHRLSDCFRPLIADSQQMGTNGLKQTSNAHPYLAR